MVLVDTSVWVSHLRDGNPRLAELLDDGEVACHPFIIGELACGNLKNRATILSLLYALPKALPAEHEECLALIDRHSLCGKGLGYVDVHILAAALLNGLSLWTFDKQLEAAAVELRCSAVRAS